MEDLRYREFEVTTIVKNYRLVGLELIGMRAGKPFTENGKIYINHNKQKNEVLDVEFINESGMSINREEIRLVKYQYFS